MAAATRAKSAGFGQGEVMTSAQANTIDTNAAGGVKRASTVSGLRTMPLAFVGYTFATATAGTTPILKSAAGQTYFPCVTTTSASRKGSFALLGLPQGHTLSAVTVRLKPSAGHGGTPAILPAAKVFKIATSGTPTAIATAAYSWVSTAAYQAGFSLALKNASGSTTLAHTILPTPYIVEIQAESGQNATGQVFILGVDVTVTVDTASGGTDFTHWIK